RAGDPLAGAHPRPLGHLGDARAVGGAKHELAGALVVEVDEAGVGVECVSDLRRDLAEHLLEVEGRVDGLDRLGQEAEMAFAGVHPPRSVRTAREDRLGPVTPATTPSAGPGRLVWRGALVEHP